MATFLSSAVVALLFTQAPETPAPPAPGDSSVAALRARLAQDSTDPRLWFELARTYARLATEYHTHRAAERDTLWVRAVIDSAGVAFGRTEELVAGSRLADSARLFRVFARGELALVAWETGGIQAAAQAWSGATEELRLTPELEELGENLLRACPREGVLLTADAADWNAAWYMRFARGLRPDLLILPLGVWRADSVFRGRVATELKLARASLATLARRRPVCASMAFERAPETRPPLRWATRPLLWVAGPIGRGDRVPPRDFVFTALRIAIDENRTWTPAALTIYRRAAAATPALCEPLGVYKLREEVGCR